jgi:hypothetical protein
MTTVDMSLSRQFLTVDHAGGLMYHHGEEEQQAQLCIMMWTSVYDILATFL